MKNTLKTLSLCLKNVQLYIFSPLDAQVAKEIKINIKSYITGYNKKKRKILTLLELMDIKPVIY